MARKGNLRPPWKPGESGNPAGYSRARRISSLVEQIIDEHGLTRDFALTWIAKALGREDMLVNKKTGEPRKPEIAWFLSLIERVEGKVPDPPPLSAGVSYSDIADDDPDVEPRPEPLDPGGDPDSQA